MANERFINIINDLEAQIEMLKLERDNEHRRYLEADHELKEALKRNVQVRVNTVEEFAERLKEDCPGNLLVIHFDGIDRIVTEMKGRCGE